MFLVCRAAYSRSRGVTSCTSILVTKDAAPKMDQGGCVLPGGYIRLAIGPEFGKNGRPLPTRRAGPRG
jgi:hypothetical protein